MAWFRRKAEERAAPAQASSEMMQFFAPFMMPSATGQVVTIQSALGVPAISAAVQVIATAVAGLPIQVYRKTKQGREPANATLQSVLNDVANEADMISAFDLVKWWMEQALTWGRGVLFIERNDRGQVLNLWPLDPTCLTIRRVNGVKVYTYQDGSRTVNYGPADVLDLPFMLKHNGVEHLSPIFMSRDVVGLAQAVTQYGATFFANGGVPPFAVTGAFQSGTPMARAADDLEAAVRKAAKEKRQALVLPNGLEIKSIGADAEKAQMTETQRFIIEQIARIYSIPPVLLQDLTNGTYSNTEQQELHFVKHTLMRWILQIEGELNLKLFGRAARTTYVEFNVEGLLRGDFKTRMEGYAAAIQNGIMKPAEARDLENWPEAEGADRLFVQGAMVPITDAGKDTTPATGPVEGGQDGA